VENKEIVYSVRIDPAASDRMYEHFEFLARVSETAANKLLDYLIKDIYSLEYMPYRNPIYNHPYLQSGKYRYMISCDRYRIVYQIELNIVYIEDIQDCRQSDSHNLIIEKQ
jgi:mRNA-degrading endonuclease RelE of RelBE toxin-antitoxin system